MRVDWTKVFRTLFNKCLPNGGDSVALAHQGEAKETGVASESRSDEVVEVRRSEMFEEKEKLASIIFDVEVEGLQKNNVQYTGMQERFTMG